MFNVAAIVAYALKKYAQARTWIAETVADIVTYFKNFKK